ncbi:hypothetical protein [Undibacterium sp. TJN25]|uniref:hypothetical protein n=1 Tax=Undibacterium sp. TJN25 TaxID=3413056 RepID=UPI003BF47F06
MGVLWNEENRNCRRWSDWCKLDRVLRGKGMDVIVTDPGDGAEEALRKYVADAWPLITRMGITEEAVP